MLMVFTQAIISMLHYTQINKHLSLHRIGIIEGSLSGLDNYLFFHWSKEMNGSHWLERKRKQIVKEIQIFYTI